MSTQKRCHIFTGRTAGLVDTYPGTDDGFPPVRVTYRRANVRRAFEHRKAVLQHVEAADNLAIFMESTKLLTEHVLDMNLLDENGERVKLDFTQEETYLNLQDGELFNWLVDRVLNRLSARKSKNSKPAPGSSSSAPNSQAEPVKNVADSSTTEPADKSSKGKSRSGETTSAEDS